MADTTETRLARKMAEYCAKTVYEYEDFLDDLRTTLEHDSEARTLLRTVLGKATSRAAEAARARRS